MSVPQLFVEVPADDFADSDVLVSSMVVDVAADDWGMSIADALYPAFNLYPSDTLYPTGPPE